jgi:hypothetical protein
LISDRTTVASELFLVRDNPGLNQDLGHRTVESRVGIASEYFFEPFTIDVPEGTLAITVAGTVTPTSADDHALRASITIVRTFDFHAKDPSKNWVISGSATYPVTATPGEVLSFTLPALPRGVEAIPTPAFSVRVVMHQTHEP